MFNKQSAWTLANVVWLLGCPDDPTCMEGTESSSSMAFDSSADTGASTEAGTGDTDTSETGPDCSDCVQGSDCETQACVNGECRYAVSCRQLVALDSTLPTGYYFIDPDGPGEIAPFEVLCDMSRDEGGWTLVMVVSDDGVSTWTWNNRALMDLDWMLVGDISALSHDYKSLAHHTVSFEDVMFVHAPSNIWAAYADVGDGHQDYGTFMALLPSPLCDEALAGQGYELSAGTLVMEDALCDTDLYFHLGDHESTLEICMGFLEEGSYGPGWSIHHNHDCPFDDPVYSSLGPSRAQPGWEFEYDSLGFARMLGLNTGASGVAENYMQIYVR